MTALHCITLFLVGLVGATPVFGEVGQDAYLAHCASCHGQDGRGQTPAGRKAHAKDLTKSKLADADIEKQIILGGPKDKKGHQEMPAFKTTLTPDEITALVSYVKTLRRPSP